LTTSLVFLGKYYIDVSAEKGILKVFVNLQNVRSNIGIYQVHVTAFGNVEIDQSKIVHTGTQTCPDDTASLCYATSEFSFPSENVPVGSKIQACAKEPAFGVENCTEGQNTPNEGPATLWIDVPDKVAER
jgi:hypothetical protein